MLPLKLRKRRDMTVKTKRIILGMAMAVGILMVTTVCASAADYSFSTEAPADYYGGTSYEEVYGSQYNYGGPNVVDFQKDAIPYGSPSTTPIGLMEKIPLPGLQTEVLTSGGGYGVGGGSELYQIPSTISPTPAVPSVQQQPVYTSVDGMERKDGSIGTVTIPSLNISMKVWEGETSASMAKGLGHYASTSGWNGNVGVCGHNRGSRYVIGSIKNLKAGDVITYTTVYGTRTYRVSFVGTISNTDWSYLQATADNRITLTTCLANHPESRVCVQAVEG